MKRMLLPLVVLLLVSSAGCPRQSESIDLGQRGVLDLGISADTGNASATVTDNAAAPWENAALVLESDQVLSVDDVALSAEVPTLPHALTATVATVTPPGAYEVAFDNRGQVANMQIAVPTPVDLLTPAAGAEVSRATGFEATWTPASESDVTIEVRVQGTAEDPRSTPEHLVTYATSISKTALSDTGAVSISAADLASFLDGSLILTVTRVRTASQQLGFAAGDVRVVCSASADLVLTE